MVAKCLEHRLYWPLYFCLLSFLLQKSVLYEWAGAEHRVLWLLSAHSNGLLSDARQCVVLGFTSIYSLHLS